MRAITSIISALVLFLSWQQSSATIIDVPGDSTTIQGGINGSNNGDTVLVQPGTYVENINFNGHNIVLASMFLATGDMSYVSQTIIDGDSAGSVVKFENGEDSTAVITGFTIQKGLASYGGGIICDSSSPAIIYNIINGNLVSGWGGGIYCYYSNPQITGNIITGNSSNYTGGGIGCNESNPMINQNTITGNTAGTHAGGINCSGSGSAIINTIFWGNSAPIGPQIYSVGTPSPVITYCDVEGGWAGTGNIDCDPLFCGPDSGNFYLYASSCCVGTGEGGTDIGAFGVGCADTYNIPSDYGTIQQGIDACIDYDTVRVAPGTYIENIDFNGKNIVVGSWFLDAGDTSHISSTVIDGNQAGSVVSFLSGEDSIATITGFTIQNGLASDGGGIHCDSSSPTIFYNIISGNSADRGGGIRLTRSSNATITENTIAGNSADRGAGIHCTSNSNLTVNYNSITGNSALYDGGGIYWFNNSGPAIRNNIISENSADPYGHGGGFYCLDSSPTISNNTINENLCAFGGGGVCCDVNSNPTIRNNTISGNLANSWGGGIYCYDSSPVIVNTILWDDNAPGGPEIYLDGASFPAISYSDVQGGWGGTSNIDCDPLFCDPDGGDFYLTDSSCCVGAGEGGVDIGALGVGCHQYIINVPGNHATIQQAINASADYDTVRVAPGTYAENINFNGKNIVVGSWFMDDSDTSYISSTIIDGGHSGSVVSFINGENNSAVITGFTIQNGYAYGTDGGGIYCDNSSPTIHHNLIGENSADQYGGGLYCNASNPKIYNNTINGNSAGAGGGICLLCFNPTINFNIISGNLALYGGGIFWYVSNGTISNNTITGNSALNEGGGFYFLDCSPPIINTILWGDSATTGSEIYLDGTSSPVITYCDVEGGWTGEGNIDCDPQFCDPDNDNYYLHAASCCIGTGEGGVDIGAYGVGCGPDIPTLSEWGMLIMALLLLAAGTVALIRRKAALRDTIQ